jgi:arylsulfatase A-like enzyme
VRRSAIFLATMVFILLTVGTRQVPARAVAGHPNVVMIITDDQVINTLQLMPNVRALARRGTTFKQAFVSNSLCCPSRATIFTGLYSHQNGVYSLDNANYGGFYAFTSNGNETRSLPYVLDGHNAEAVNYNTALFGKYLNNYPGDDPTIYPADYVPAGWDTWDAFSGKNGNYYNYTLIQKDGLAPPVFETHKHDPSLDYSTNVLGDDAVTWLGAQDESTPFFLYFAPYGPHGPQVPAPGDEGITAPTPFKTPSFNEADVSDKPPYVQSAPLYTATDIANLQGHWDRQYATLASIDRYVGSIEDALTPTQLSNTVFVFMSDNGYTFGDHRFDYKLVPYERSIRVPLIIAGAAPTQPRGDHHIVMNADLMPTILQLTGLTPAVPNALPFDGVSLTPLLGAGGTWAPRSAILLEHLDDPTTLRYVPSYCGVRTSRWMYAVYVDGFQELYDLKADPNELTNIAASRPVVLARRRVETQQLCDPLPPDFPSDFWSQFGP